MGKIEEFLKVEHGDGSGNGYGYGDGNGSGDGDGDGSGSGNGSGNGYGNGSGYGNGTGNGYGNGDGYGYGYGITMINGEQVYQVDSVATIIRTVKDNIAKGAILQSDLTQTKCFVIKRGNYFAHGETLKEAKEALEAKLFEELSVEERIEEFVERFNLCKKYPAMDFFDWHNKLTGSCEMGRKAFASDHNIDLDNDKMTVEEFIKLTKNSFEGQIIKMCEERLKA